MFLRLFFSFALLMSYSIYAQNDTTTDSSEEKKSNLESKKKLKTLFANEKISIDGKLDETIWDSSEIAKDFVMFQPDNGKPIAQNKRTEVKVLYDNEAIYIGALLYDDEPNKILKEISQRDEFGVSDNFGVFINGYNDGQQNFQFYATASDGQADCINTDSNGEDFSWDAIWSSKAIITDFGWAVEMRIPYAALRFSSEKKQTWGINFSREIRRDRQKYSWNFIDSKLGTFTQQTGILEGIENIKPPTRLFFLPYASYYLNADKENKTKGTLKGGMDIKYGINDAFTLDAILIPDFGQTTLDRETLNLGPFEQQFNENRSFFTEGTNLFSKGNLFYSRRIGGQPSIDRDQLEEQFPSKVVLDYPRNVSLINALKISGRTKNGLGVGFLNAVTEKTFAKIQDTLTGEISSKIIEPLANFNVLVFDQRFRKNSSISFLNTNVTRNNSFRDANVSALVWDLNTKKNTYNLSGDLKYSYINDLEDKKGVSTSLNFGETSGKYRYNLGSSLVTKDYEINDLGINFETNYYTFSGNTSYRILNPTKHFNRFKLTLDSYAQFQKETSKIQGNFARLYTNIDNIKNQSYGGGINVNIAQAYDYYEPRVTGRYSIDPYRYSGFCYFSSNYNKKFAIDISPTISYFSQKGRTDFDISIEPRYRFNDRFSLKYNFFIYRRINFRGYATQIDTDANPLTPRDIIYGNRDQITYTNSLSGKYSINSQMNFNISVFHYWSYSENKKFLLLEQNGLLSDYTGTVSNKDRSLSFWNLDLSYSWWFAPGSQVSVLYRNNSGKYSQEVNKDFAKNFTNLINNDVLQHTFSISVKYFIDYNQVKNWF
jgi:hypothetical protein